MKIFIIIILLLCYSNTILAQQNNINHFASKAHRDSLTTSLKLQIDETIKLEFRDRYFLKYKGSFWAMQLMLYRPKNYEKNIPIQLQLLHKAPADLQYAFLEMLYTIYPKKFGTAIKNIFHQLKSNKVKALALQYLSKTTIAIKKDSNDIFFKSPHYMQFANSSSLRAIKLPTKNDIFKANIFPNENVLVSFQSANRNIPGYIMLRQNNGKWKTDKLGKPIKYTQLARSISNLPFYLTNGNTPQGLYKILGVDTSSNEFIGTTSNLQMVMPFEEDKKLFFGSETSYQSYYNSLLGNLVQYKGLQQSFIAGQLGRSEIIAHGTTINPAYYIAQSYYPCTPSLGCLCSPEIWANNGELKTSEQKNWMEKFVLQGELPKWLLVVEVKDL